MARKIIEENSFEADRRKEKRIHLNILVEFEIRDRISRCAKRYKSESVNICGNGILINAIHLPAKS